MDFRIRMIATRIEAVVLNLKVPTLIGFCMAKLNIQLGVIHMYYMQKK